jgi:hypothetical protein
MCLKSARITYVYRCMVWVDSFKTYDIMVLLNISECVRVFVYEYEVVNYMKCTKLVGESWGNCRQLM